MASKPVSSVGVPAPICPVQALRDRLDTSPTHVWPAFRQIDRWDSVEHHRLGADAIRRILGCRPAPRLPSAYARAG